MILPGLLCALAFLHQSLAQPVVFSNVGAGNTTCTTPECAFQCDDYQGCSGARFYTTDVTTTVTIECSGVESCQNFQLYANNINSLTVRCSIAKACYRAEIYAEHAVLDLSCDYAGNTAATAGACYSLAVVARQTPRADVFCNDNNCQDTIFYLSSASSVSFLAQGSYAARFAKVFVQDMVGALNLTCLGDRSCNGASFYASQMQGDLAVSCHTNTVIGQNACYQTKFYVEDLVGNMDLWCNSTDNPGHNACYDVSIFAYDMQGDISAECIGYTSCYSILVDAGTMNGDVRLNCSGYDACFYADIFTQDINGSLSMYCPDQRSCFQANVHCPADCDVQCFEYMSCYNMDFNFESTFDAPLALQCTVGPTFTCRHEYLCSSGAQTSMRLNGDSSAYECTDFDCCPFDAGLRTCTVGAACVIDCAAAGECQGFRIDGSDATSLTVNCQGSQSCQGAKIACPASTTGTACVLNCEETSSCSAVSVRATGDHDLAQFAMNCGGASACLWADVMLNVTSVASVSLVCNSPLACQSLDFATDAAIGNASVSCDAYQACNALEFAADSIVSVFDFGCLHNQSCFDASVGVTVGTFARLECSGAEACKRGRFDVKLAQNAAFAVDCLYSDAQGFAACNGSNVLSTGLVADTAVTMVSCLGDSCHDLNFVADGLQSVRAQCQGPNACYSGVFDVDTVSNFDLLCNGTSSCGSASVLCPSHAIGACNLECLGTAVGSRACASLNVQVEAAYVYGFLALRCESDGTATDSLEQCTGLSVACNSTGRIAANFIWSSSSLTYECQNVGVPYCCPYYDGPKIECSSGGDCVVDCTQTDCSSTLIDAQQASFLTVYCEERAFGSGCDETHVLCPLGGCNITCSGAYSCGDYAKIFYHGALSDNAHVAVRCDDGTGQLTGPSCPFLAIHASTASNVRLDCIDDPSVNSYNSYACDQVALYAQYAGAVALDIREEFSSMNSEFHVENAGVVTFSASGSRYASRSDTIHAANAGSLTVSCSSDHLSWNACSDNDFYIPQQTTLNCYGRSCYNLKYLYSTLEAAELAQHLVVNVYACEKCDSVQECLSFFYLRCGPTYAVSQGFNQNSYGARGGCALPISSPDDCGCEDIIASTNFYTTEGQEQCYGYVPPTASPTAAPTALPTASPSGAPTVSPTVSPTVAPTLQPSENPTAATESPTTASPTIIPSIDPTWVPYVDPTAATRDPTQSPSLLDFPSTSETTNIATSSPVLADTTTITFSSTEQNEIYSTASSSSSSTATTDDDGEDENTSTIVTIYSTDSGEEAEKEARISAVLDLNALYGTVAVIWTGLWVTVGGLAFIDAACLRMNDYFRIQPVLSMYFQSMDTISDCFFAAQMYIYVHNNVDAAITVASLGSDIYDIMFYLGIFCIAVPNITSMLQLYFYARKHWVQHDHIATWISGHSYVLLLMSLFTGSAFAAVALLNSFMFKLEVFDMGLSQKQLKGFNTRRLYSIVFLENVPQICLQVLFLWNSISVGLGVDIIAVSSIAFSIISVFVSILSVAMEKTINFHQSFVILSIEITGMDARGMTQSRTRCAALLRELSQLIGVPKRTMEIFKPMPISRGLKVIIHLYLTSNEHTDYMNFGAILNDAKHDGELARVFETGWELSQTPNIRNITCEKMDSKHSKRNPSATAGNETLEMITQQIETQEIVIDEGADAGLSNSGVDGEEALPDEIH